MKTKITINEMKFIGELYKKKYDELQDRLDRLGIEDVKEDSTYQKTQQDIKKQIILKPVMFQDPRIIKHQPTEKPESGVMGGTRKMIEVEINFPFTGSAELFGYRPDDEFRVTHTNIFLPEGIDSNHITIIVDTVQLDKAAVLKAAHIKMEPTTQLINIVNNHIRTWSVRVEEDIDEKLRAKRNELIKFYS